MSTEPHHPPREPSRGTRRSDRLDRLLLVAHLAAALLAADIVADVVTLGRLMPWPHGGTVAAAVASLSLAFLLASLPWDRRAPRRAPVRRTHTVDRPPER